MGTDIHMYIEKRDVDGNWQMVLPPEPPPENERTTRHTYHPGAKNHLTGEPFVGEYDYVSPFWGPGGCFYVSRCYGIDEGCEGASCVACAGTGRDTHWYNRNYNLFAILTGTVRNGYGFAGTPRASFNGITAEPRGVPDDISDAVNQAATWDHSPSWLTLAEILAYDWDQVSTHVGVIPLRAVDDRFEKDPDPYETWRTTPPHRPRKWSGSISGPNIRTVSTEEADRLLSAPETITGSVYVTVTWPEAYRESVDDFLAFLDQYVIPLAAGGDAADVRLVFGFDS